MDQLESEFVSMKISSNSKPQTLLGLIHRLFKLEMELLIRTQNCAFNSYEIDNFRKELDIVLENLTQEMQNSSPKKIDLSLLLDQRTSSENTLMTEDILKIVKDVCIDQDLPFHLKLLLKSISENKFSTRKDAYNRLEQVMIQCFENYDFVFFTQEILIVLFSGFKQLTQVIPLLPNQPIVPFDHFQDDCLDLYFHSLKSPDNDAKLTEKISGYEKELFHLGDLIAEKEKLRMGKGQAMENKIIRLENQLEKNATYEYDKASRQARNQRRQSSVDHMFNNHCEAFEGVSDLTNTLLHKMGHDTLSTQTQFTQVDSLITHFDSASDGFWKLQFMQMMNGQQCTVDVLPSALDLTSAVRDTQQVMFSFRAYSSYLDLLKEDSTRKLQQSFTEKGMSLGVHIELSDWTHPVIRNGLSVLENIRLQESREDFYRDGCGEQVLSTAVKLSKAVLVFCRDMPELDGMPVIVSLSQLVLRILGFRADTPQR